MSETIWKYEIPLRDSFSLLMPAGAKLLTAQTQAGVPMLWCVVEPSAPEETRWFELRGTGHQLGEVGDYIATLQLQGDALVLHLFALNPEPSHDPA